MQVVSGLFVCLPQSPSKHHSIAIAIPTRDSCRSKKLWHDFLVFSTRYV